MWEVFIEVDTLIMHKESLNDIYILSFIILYCRVFPGLSHSISALQKWARALIDDRGAHTYI